MTLKDLVRVLNDTYLEIVCSKNGEDVTVYDDEYQISEMPGGFDGTIERQDLPWADHRVNVVCPIVSDLDAFYTKTIVYLANET